MHALYLSNTYCACIDRLYARNSPLNQSWKVSVPLWGGGGGGEEGRGEGYFAHLFSLQIGEQGHF